MLLTSKKKMLELTLLTCSLMSFYANAALLEHVPDYNCLPKLKTLSALYDNGYNQVQTRRQSILEHIDLGLEQSQQDILSITAAKEFFTEVQKSFENEMNQKSDKAKKDQNEITFYIAPSDDQVSMINQFKAEIENQTKLFYSPRLTYGQEAKCTSEYTPYTTENKRVLSAKLQVSCTYNSINEKIIKRRVDVSIVFPKKSDYAKFNLKLQLSVVEYGEFGNDGEEKLFYVIERSASKDLISEKGHRQDKDEVDRQDFQIATAKALESSEFYEKTIRFTNRTYDEQDLLRNYLNKSCVIPGEALIGEWTPYSPKIYNINNDADDSMSFKMTDLFPSQMLDSNGVVKQNFQNKRFNHTRAMPVNLYLRNGQIGALLSVAKDIPELSDLRSQQLAQIEKFKAQDQSFCWIRLMVPPEANIVRLVNPLSINREYVSWKDSDPNNKDKDLLTVHTEINNPDIHDYPIEGVFSKMTNLVCQESLPKKSPKINFSVEEVFSHLNPGKLQMRLFLQKNSWDRRKDTKSKGVQP